MCALAPTAAPRPWPRPCAQLTMHLTVDLGARVTEICHLDLPDLGHRSDATGAQYRIVTLRMKGNKIRVRPIPVPLAPLLDAWLARRIADPGETALLVDRDGTRITRYQVEYLVQVLAAAASVPDPQQITRTPPGTRSTRSPRPAAP
ncbi:tyrosine-type recombinase/integrase, partial [Amycolatopsis sp. NPDC000673]|uniref:tyrosine-type recombinase/integrase n=1 Tax=Amycolatopsis sp. NPDC000673 TaxID=3154267 RepID=UPI00331695CB